MSETESKIAQLETRLDSLVRTQIDFQVEVTAIRKELSRLRGQSPAAGGASPSPTKAQRATQAAAPDLSGERSKPPPRRDVNYESPYTRPPSFGSQTGRPVDGRSDTGSRLFDKYAVKARTDLEKFIGENLISKIGIVVLVLGVGIGAKYAIDNNLVSPLLWIILGYVMGFGLLGFAAWLKPKYHSFSAILLGGGIAVLYFITYFAYSLYGLLNQPTAFAVMAMLTAFTVAAAVFYNLQVIAHLGLVGAYAVPFLLSTDSGNYAALFGYIAVVNSGVLALSVRRFWRALFYTSSAFTWLIFGLWGIAKYDASAHLYLALGTLAVFFAIFYLTKIAHGIVHSESDDFENIGSIAVTAAIFYTFCLGISNFAGSTSQYALIFAFLAVAGLMILLTSYRFYGRVLVFVVYPATWLIFGFWFITRFNSVEHFALAASFAGVFFAVFYGATLVYRLATDDLAISETAGVMLTNSFIFYGFGYAILDSRTALQPFQGLFTVAHASMHFAVAQFVGRLKADATDVVQVLTILIITFVTIAVPIHFDGNFVTLVWTVEAAVLFYFGRVRQARFFEYFTYPLMVLAGGSLVLDWIGVYADRAAATLELAPRPFANGDMITGFVFVIAWAFIYVAHTDEEKESILDDSLKQIFGYAVVVAGVFALYNGLRMEIGNFLHFEAVTRGGTLSSIQDLARFNAVAQINYTMLFLTLMTAVNLRKFGSAVVAAATTVLSIMTLGIMLTVGMFLLYELRVSYLAGTDTMIGTGLSNVLIRPISYAFTAGLLISIYLKKQRGIVNGFVDTKLQELIFDSILYPTLLIFASCELMNTAAQVGIADAEKYGLSILWGLFSLALIAIGIAKERKHLRVSAIVLLAVTLGKLFFFDITNLGTIPKTILFVSLGLLMLLVSFLYNKYKDTIAGPHQAAEE